MPRSNPQPKPVLRPARPHATPPTISGRWLLAAIAVAIPGAAFCAWAVLWLLFWQGSWQLLYHPTSTITRTPASAALAFDAIGFAPTDTGAPQLQGWWIAAPSARTTVLYLHGQDGNLSDTVDDLARLHTAGVNIFAFDYRGYGQSLFAHPSEAHWREDTASALQYLTGTRHIDPHSIVLDGTALGANLALEVAAAHPELAGVILEGPINAPIDAIFADPRARLVPAHLLVTDRYDTAAPATSLRIPSLWFFKNGSSTKSSPAQISGAYQKVTAPKMQVQLSPSPSATQDFTSALTRWLDDLK
jgi:pimeloyl-ACP methyl ester carboxylesterase